MALTRILLDAGAFINAKSKKIITIDFFGCPGMTALALATKYNRIESVKLLLDRGAKVDIKNSEGDTAYDIAVKNANGQLADILFFKNSAAFNQGFAYVFYMCLVALPFVSCAIWLYMNYILFYTIHESTFIVSLSLGLAWFFSFNMYNSIPLIKAICLISSIDCALIWQWVWAWGTASDTSVAYVENVTNLPPVSVEMRMIFCAIFTWLCLNVAWIIEPLLRKYFGWRHYLVIWLIGLWSTWNRFKTSDANVR
jgi:hypothetical protein